MPGRKYTAGSSYRYGFNGKENDNDVKNVEGSQQDYGMRIYDPRVGKFLSVDPLTASYSWFSPYQFSGNSPITSFDIDGLEPNKQLNYSEVNVVESALENIKGKKLSYENTSWVGPLWRWKPLIFTNNVLTEAYNQNVSTIQNTPSNLRIIKNVFSKKGRIENANYAFTAFGYLVTWWNSEPEKRVETYEAAGGMLLNGWITKKIINLSKPQELNIDLMGGQRSSIRGWLNFDNNAIEGIRSDVKKFGQFFTKNSVSSIITNNPQAEFLPYVTNSLKEGGTITVRGQMANAFFKEIWNGTAKGLENYEVIGKTEGLSIDRYYRTDGSPLRGGAKSLNEIILKKKTP